MVRKALDFTSSPKNKELQDMSVASNSKPSKQWPTSVDDAPPKPKKSSTNPGDFHDTSSMEDSPTKPKKQCLSTGKVDISTVEDPTPHATIHRMLASLSPLKPSKYFEAELTDGSKCIRMVGFDKSQQVTKAFPSNSKTAKTTKKRFDQLKVIVRNSTQIELSPTK